MAQLICVTPFDVFAVNCRGNDYFRLLDEGHGLRGVRKAPDSAKADLAAASLGEALKLCIEATGLEGPAQRTTDNQRSRKMAA